MFRFMSNRVMATRTVMNAAKRNFSTGQLPPTKSGALPWIIGAGALGGFTALNMYMA
jgi:hypothetical protein